MRGRSDFESSEVMMSRIFGLMFKKLKLERVIIGLEEWVFLWLTIFYDKRRMEELFLDVFFRFFLKGKKKKTKIEPEVNSKKNSSPTELGLSRLIYDSSSMWKNMKNFNLYPSRSFVDFLVLNNFFSTISAISLFILKTRFSHGSGEENQQWLLIVWNMKVGYLELNISKCFYDECQS